MFQDFFISKDNFKSGLELLRLLNSHDIYLYAMIQETRIKKWRKTMTITTEAIYEQGVLKIPQLIPLAEGTRVEVIVISTKSSENCTSGTILAEIAALPLEGKDDGKLLISHDTYLY
jgi:predicted DNA-binding antitoxin AbrB/MazE fold protein